MSRIFYRLQMKAGSSGETITEKVLAESRITADIDYAGEQFGKLQPGDLIMVHKSSDPVALSFK